jgi:hypothetical protein
MNVRRARNIWGGISFKHSTPLARLLSVVVALALVGLIGLAAGPASASGSGSAAGAAGAGSVGPSSLGSSTTTSTSTKSTSTKSSSASSATRVGKVALTSKESLAAQVANLIPAIAVDCLPSGSGSLVGGFEIDGDTCVNNGGQDWASTGLHTDDGFADDTAFTNGSSENDDPQDWGIGGSPNGKTDIGEFWAYSKAINNTVYGYFGLTNDSTSGGTSQYDLEYNQLAAVPGDGGHPVPNRSAGDLLFRFSSTGSDPIAFTDAKRYTEQDDAANWDDNKCFITDDIGGWCTIPIPANAFAQQVNSDGTFFEGAIDIGLFTQNPGDCTGNFGVTSVHSVTGNAFATSALKDYVDPLPVNTPSTCGSIVINKFDAGNTHVGGAHFTISPDPTPGSNDPGPVDLVDGGTGDADNTANGVITINPAEADEYTVVETQAPPGYLLPPDVADRTVVVTLAPGSGQVATFNFHDPLQWKALTAVKTANPTYTAQYAWSIAKEISADGQDPWVTDSSLLTPLVKNVPPNGDPTDATLSYRVKVTAGARTTSNYAVSGNITVTNPNDDPVTANISDALPGATCLVEGDATHTVAVASGEHAYAYVCSFAGVPTDNQLSGDNTATVTWDKSTYPQTDDDQTADGDYSISPKAAYAFGAETTSIDKTVTVTDDHHVFPGGLQVTWTGEGDVTTSDVYTIPFQASPGDCSAIITNTASITGDSDVLGTANAYGQVCVPLGLGVADSAVGDFTRQYLWKIDKFIDGDQKSQTVTTDGGLEATFDYTVAATPLAAQDSAWVVSGTITVNNPNVSELIDPISVTGASELLDVGVTADCVYTLPQDHPTFPFDLASGEDADIGFTCTLPPTPANDGLVPPTYEGNHQANATFGDTGTVTSDSQALAWNDPTEIDKTLAVYDDKVTEGAAPVHLGDAVWNAEGTPTTFDYQLTFTVPASTEGSCAPEFDNLAWLGGDGVTPTELQSGASAIICVPAVIPPEPPQKSPLPDTGGPDAQLLLWGLALLVTGGGVVLLTSRRRERRS